MKIGFFGNPNNYPFMLARACRRLGHEVVFIVDSSHPLHRPEYRYDDVPVPYPAWIRDLAPGLPPRIPKKAQVDQTLGLLTCSYRTPKQRRILELLNSCDAAVLSAAAPALNARLSVPFFIQLVGYDIELLANYRAIPAISVPGASWFTLPWRLLLRRMHQRIVPEQRAGIRKAAAYNTFAKGLVPAADALLAEIGAQDSRRVFFMMTDVEALPYVPPQERDTVRIFCGARFNWKRPLSPGMSELDYKGSDVMIRGLGRFARETGVRMEVRFVRKGIHVAEAVSLVEEEGLSSQVTWLDEMTQAEVWEEYKHADIVFDHLGSAIFGMVTMDAMATGRPVITNARPDILQPLIGSTPICHAVTPDDVMMQLKRLVPDQQERLRVGLESRTFAEQFFSAEHGARICLERLKRAGGHGS